MRKITMLLFCLCIGWNINAQEISDKQWVHIQKRTADWCPNCGLWGWDFKEAVLEEFAEKEVLTWSTHMASSGLSNPTSVALVNNYGGSGQPRFYRDGADIGLSPSNGATKLEEIRQLVEFNESLPAFYGCASLASYNGTAINTTSKAKLFIGSEQSVIRMGVYLMKKETIANQSQQGNNAVHKNLVIDHLTDDVFGPIIVNGDGEADNEYSFDSSIEMPADIDPTEYNIVTVLWAYIAATDNFQFLNAHIAEVSNSVNTKDAIETNTNIVIDATNKSNVLINIDSQEAYTDARISILSANGQLVSESTTNLSANNNNFTFDLSNNTTGLFILNITSLGETVSKQFYVR